MLLATRRNPSIRATVIMNFNSPWLKAPDVRLNTAAKKTQELKHSCYNCTKPYLNLQDKLKSEVYKQDMIMHKIQKHTKYYLCSQGVS